MAVLGLRYHRNRLAGEMKQLEEANESALRRIDRILAEIKQRKTKLATLKEQVILLGDTVSSTFGIEVGPPAPRKTIQKHHLLDWGGIKNGTLKTLRLARGAPLTSMQIARAIEKDAGINCTQAEIIKIRDSVYGALKKLRLCGIACSLSKQTVPGKSITWALSTFTA